MELFGQPYQLLSKLPPKYLIDITGDAFSPYTGRFAYLKPKAGWTSTAKAELKEVVTDITEEETAAELALLASKGDKPKYDMSVGRADEEDRLHKLEWELQQTAKFAYVGRGKRAIGDLESLPKNIEFGRIVNTGLEGGVGEDKTLIGSKKRKTGRSQATSMLRDDKVSQYISTKLAEIND